MHDASLTMLFVLRLAALALIRVSCHAIVYTTDIPGQIIYPSFTVSTAVRLAETICQ